MSIDQETLARWRADAIMRGGTPAPSDRDPQTRYLANRVVALIDMLTGEPRHVAPEPQPEPYVEVITRYGGHRHLARGNDTESVGRHFTLCRGTSSWTIHSWVVGPDAHPLNISTGAMRELPLCRACSEQAAGL